MKRFTFCCVAWKSEEEIIFGQLEEAYLSGIKRVEKNSGCVSSQ